MREKDRPNYEDRKATRRAYYLSNEDQFRGYQYQRYGITVADYELMFALQGGRCAMCGKQSKRRLDVDHNHKTNKVRGLLCGPCNRALGHYEERQDAILAYLGKYDA